MLLERLAARDTPGRVLVVDDAYGALAVSLAASSPTVALDSWTARAASTTNHERNACATPGFVDPLDLQAMPDRFDVAVLRMPRALGRLDELLGSISAAMSPGAAVYFGGMAKRMPGSMFVRLETVYGEIDVSRAWRKARVISASVTPSIHTEPRWPVWTAIELAGHDFEMAAHGGVFSGERLDPATRLLGGHVASLLERVGAGGRVMDLGCGTGVLGTVAGRLDPTADIVLVDDSVAAIRSAAATAEQSGVSAESVHAGRLDQVASASVDLVLCNPPFHDDRGQNDEIAWTMFHDARRVLRRGGLLAVVANRHLGHHARLRKVFGRADVVSNDPSFVVTVAERA